VSTQIRQAQDCIQRQRAGAGFLAMVFLVWSMALLWPHAGMAQDRQAPLETFAPQKINLTVGKSMLVRSPKPVKRFALADPQLADPVIITSQQVYLSGKAVGITNLTLWGEDDRVLAIFEVEVAPDLSQLQAKLQEILPEEAIRVTAAHDTITLFGEVSSPAHLSMALTIAQAFAPKVSNLMRVAGLPQEQSALSPFLLVQLQAKLQEILPGEAIRVTAAHDAITLFGEVSSATHLSEAVALAEAYAPKVINLLHVLGVHQVMLEVRVAEMSRSLTRQLLTRGVNLQYKGRHASVGVLNNPAALSAVFPASAFFSLVSGDFSLAGAIDALKENGLVKLLAEPTLVTLSGQEASFLAGGEIPVPVPQRENVITIEFKPFGVGLRFTPTVLSPQKISLRVAPEVSELDFANAVTVSGFVVPALTVRRASTVIELADGQGFAIAGLLNESVRETISKLPGLGDIPILGALFRSSQFQKNETELVILVTPRLVKPIDPTTQALPTDQFIEPSDAEFYLLGQVEGQRQGALTTGRLDGKFGYIYGPLGEAP
jgi:pilus assembly protein CpaC